MCGHYGTTAIIRDFPFAPYLFLVSLFRAHQASSLSVLSPPHSERCIYIYVYASVCKRRRGKCTWLRDSGNEKRATNGFSAALVRVHSDETMERGELDEKKEEEEVTEEVTTGV